MMEAVSTSETLVSVYHTTLRNIPEDSHLHTRRLENLKSHLLCITQEEGTNQSQADVPFVLMRLCGRRMQVYMNVPKGS
jgi:hypothetical protein